ncbi:unnamed protein product [Dracunculus medinensis]|uniref:C2 NT-type domain-containing protein n=1 Tax=Dracunculus medinensis TaxID=318479 RepID=A0A0N4UBV4_DRAME|nr:unnamed protein product [Dracunculus medinensis]
MAFLKKKGFKFNVDLELLKLSDMPLVNAVLFAKVRLLEGGTFEGVTERVFLFNHAACWNARFNFSCRIPPDPVTGVLERCACRVSLRREQKGGKSYQKLGFVDINLSQFAASGVEGITQSFLLDGYGVNQRQDNSRIVVKIIMSHQSADPIFKVPRKESSMEEEFLNPVERRAPPSGNSNGYPNPSCVDTISSRSSSVDELYHDCDDFSVESLYSPLITSLDPSDKNKLGRMSISVPNVQSFDVIRRTTINNSAIPQNRRFSQDRSQIKCCESGITRIHATRVDAEDVIDQMLAETVMPSIKNHEDYSDQGLALFVSKDGEAVIGGNTLRSSGSFERVHIADAGVT